MKTRKLHLRTATAAIESNENLIDTLYTSPEKVAEWFRKKHVTISMKECEKLMIHLHL
jgi:hypothetical protein